MMKRLLVIPAVVLACLTCPATAHAVFEGYVARSLCGAAGRTLNPLVTEGFNWTVPYEDNLCQVNQTSLDVATPQVWLIHFPVERSIAKTTLHASARVFGGNFLKNQVCARTVTFNNQGLEFHDSYDTCTYEIGGPMNQVLDMAPVQLPRGGSVIMRFSAFPGGIIYRATVNYKSNGS